MLAGAYVINPQSLILPRNLNHGKKWATDLSHKREEVFPWKIAAARDPKETESYAHLLMRL